MATTDTTVSASLTLTNVFQDDTNRTLTISNLNPSTVNLETVRNNIKVINQDGIAQVELHQGYVSDSGAPFKKIEKAEFTTTQDIPFDL